jgi:hypothetical protein
MAIRQRLPAAEAVSTIVAMGEVNSKKGNRA